MQTEIQIATQKFKSKDYLEFKKIIRKNPDFIKTGGKMWFRQAASDADIAGLTALLDSGFDLNEPDYFGPPLANAASYGSINVIQWMLNNGAKIDLSEIHVNPLFSAIQSGHKELVKFFVDYGVDTKIVYPCGRDAIAFAKTWGLREIIEILGGDPNQKRQPWVNTSLPDLTGVRLSKKDLDIIEMELDVKLPDFYRDFLNDFPNGLYHVNCKDNDDWEWLSDDYPLFHTARSIIAYNCEDPQQKKKIRRYPEYIAIGTNASDDFYCLKEGEYRNVYFFDHELEDFEDMGVLFEDFIREAIETHLENIKYDLEQSLR